MEYWAETRSGPGSTVHNTNRIRLALEEVIRSHGVTSILDAPCGDATWMPLVRGIDQAQYLGADISPSIVEDNRRKFSKLQNHSGGTGDEDVASANAGGLHGASFIQADLVEGIPPSIDGKPYDLIFVRSDAEGPCLSSKTSLETSSYSSSIGLLMLPCHDGVHVC